MLTILPTILTQILTSFSIFQNDSLLTFVSLFPYHRFFLKEKVWEKGESFGAIHDSNTNQITAIPNRKLIYQVLRHKENAKESGTR
jgi:hypothetical protein